MAGRLRKAVIGLGAAALIAGAGAGYTIHHESPRFFSTLHESVSKWGFPKGVDVAYRKTVYGVPRLTDRQVTDLVKHR